MARVIFVQAFNMGFPRSAQGENVQLKNLINIATIVKIFFFTASSHFSRRTFPICLAPFSRCSVLLLPTLRISAAATAAAAEAMADYTSGIRHTRKRQNYALNIYDKPNPLSTLKTHQPFLSVYTIKTRSQQGTARTRRGGGCCYKQKP